MMRVCLRISPCILSAATAAHLRSTYARCMQAVFKTVRVQVIVCIYNQLCIRPPPLTVAFVAAPIIVMHVWCFQAGVIRDHGNVRLYNTTKLGDLLCCLFGVVFGLTVRETFETRDDPLPQRCWQHPTKFPLKT